MFHRVDVLMIPLIKQVSIRNYKSIGKAVVELEPFTAFVGPNGAGKSNFIDALAFVQECLAESIELAFKNRGGISAVRRRSGGHPTHIGIRLQLDLEDNAYADYSFEIAAERTEKFKVARERCIIGQLMREHVFELEDGVFKKEIRGIRTKVLSDRLALFAASATEEFRPVYDFLTAMRFYSIAPERLRELQEPDPGELLKREGSNAAAVLKRLREEHGAAHYERVCLLLSKVVEGIEKVEYSTIGNKERLQFKQDIGQKHPWTFDALNMSDGTLRVLGLFLAIYQSSRPSVIAVEEPEATVHPAAAEVVIESLMDAANERQILVTTHSPDILDYKDIEDSQIRVVTMSRGNTNISEASEASRKAIRDRLYTPGELLRVNELNPDFEKSSQEAKQLNLFGAPYRGKSYPS